MRPTLKERLLSHKLLLLFILGTTLSFFSYFYFATDLSPDAPSRSIAQVELRGSRQTVTALKTIEEVSTASRKEEVVRLKDARIVIADYDLIKRDFPAMGQLSNDEIDRWLIDQVAFISLPQAKNNVVNTAIPVDSYKRTAYRPPAYKRAHVFEMYHPYNVDKKIGLVDVKGSGALHPAQASHGNGLATLGECIREYIFENLVREVLDDADLPNKTVGSYAVIDAGFEVIHADGSTSRAGLYLRQGHNRYSSEGWLDRNSRLKIEGIFKEYGLFTSENIQGTKTEDIVDFGHYIVRNDMKETLPQKQIPFDIWGYDPHPGASLYGWDYSKLDHPWYWSHDLAADFAKGKANRDHVWQHFQNFINPVRERFHYLRTGNLCVDALQNLIIQ